MKVTFSEKEMNFAKENTKRFSFTQDSILEIAEKSRDIENPTPVEVKNEDCLVSGLAILLFASDFIE